MFVKEAAILWNLTERRVAALCKDGKIQGAKKDGKSWIIPDDAEKPVDNRIRSGLYVNRKEERLSLPVGVSDYKEVVKSYYYVDKTLLIRDVIDQKSKVMLFTRPRRFGKTLNMDMLRTFFENTDDDASCYFRDKAIWKAGKQYREYLGKYPVIYISFKDVKDNNWEETFEDISKLIQMEYRRHSELKGNRALSNYDYYERIDSGKFTYVDIKSSIKILADLLAEHFRQPAVIIIDEYDTPIQQGYMRGFYRDVVDFMRVLFSGAFKDNSNLAIGFLTGILRVAKESIFSGLNNLVVYSVLDDKYSEYFGFTYDEVGKMARYYGAEAGLKEIIEWYDGYRFGSSDIFNPWSVINYFCNNQKTEEYWVSTSSNDVIGNLISEADSYTIDKLQALVKGESVQVIINPDIVYPEMRNNPSSVFGFLVVAGYLNALNVKRDSLGYMVADVRIPNEEIRRVYSKEILNRFMPVVNGDLLISVWNSITTGDADNLKHDIEEILLKSASYHDTANESFYHGFVLAITCLMGTSYKVSSNKESGDGRYDIMLLPVKNNLPGIIIEIKAGRKGDNLKSLAESAVRQISEKRYKEYLLDNGVSAIIGFGIAFIGKNVEIISC